MSLKNILLAFLVISSSLYSEKYGPYDLSLSHPISTGMGSWGVGLNNPVSSLYSNTALLSAQSKYLVDGGVGFSAAQNRYSPLKPVSLGFYVPVGDNFGWGISGKETFYQNFFGRQDRMSAYTVLAFGSYKISEHWYISLGVGPSLVYRGGYQSKYSISATGSIAYQNNNHSLGLTAQSVGKFRLDGYRDVDSLKERLPEIAGIGYSYKWKQTLFYFEGRKIFWEKSSFDLNKENSKPDLERGLGAEIKLSSGIQYSLKERLIDLRAGLETGGFYDIKGVNRRAAGLALGVSWNYKTADEEELFGIHLAVLNYSVFSKKGGRVPETLFSLSLSYLF